MNLRRLHLFLRNNSTLLALSTLFLLPGCAGLQNTDWNTLLFGSLYGPPYTTGPYGQNLVWTPDPHATSLSTPLPIKLEELKIPAQHGKVDRVWKAQNATGPKILHFRDAPANYVAQKHLAAILDHLIRQHGLYLVLVEGGSKNDSLTHMRKNAPLKQRINVAEEFLRSGKISGENYLDLTTDHEFLVYGIEDRELYDQQMEIHKKLRAIQKEAVTSLASFQKLIKRLKPQIYPGSVLALEQKALDVDAGRLQLSEHYEILAQEAIPSDLEAYPNIKRFLEIARIEKELDWKILKREKEKFIRALESLLPNAEFDKIKRENEELADGTITASFFYKRLKQYLNPEQVKEYPTLAKNIEYRKTFDEIDFSALSAEEEELGEQIKLRKFTNENEKLLAQIARDVGVAENLISFDSTPERFAYYQKEKGNFKPTWWADALQKIGREQEPPIISELDPAPLNEALVLAEKFYLGVLKRDEAMVRNALKRTEEFQVPFAVLITGGFHTPEIIRLFREKQISHAVVSPKVGRVTLAEKERLQRVIEEVYMPMSKKYREKLKEN